MSRALHAPRTPAPRRRGPTFGWRQEMGARERVIRGAAGVVLVLGLWQILSDTGVIKPAIWSSPADIGRSFLDLVRLGALGPAALESFTLFLWGYLIAVVVGVTAGVVLGWYRRPRAVFDPWVSMLNAAPRVGLIPLIIAAVGIGLEAQVTVVWVSAVFPILINVAVAVDSTDPDNIRVARSYLASNPQILLHVTLPSALPLIIAGLRQGLTAALIGVVIAEYFIGNEGVGGLILLSAGSGMPGRAFVGAFLFSIAALVLTSLLRLIERRVSTWR